MLGYSCVAEYFSKRNTTQYLEFLSDSFESDTNALQAFLGETVTLYTIFSLHTKNIYFCKSTSWNFFFQKQRIRFFLSQIWHMPFDCCQSDRLWMDIA